MPSKPSKWLESLKVIGGIAPMIATAAAGPLAGSAVTAIEGAFGLHPTVDLPLTKRQEAITSAVAEATPETLLELKKADLNFQARMAELGFADAESLTRLAVDDRDSARKREMSVRDWTPHILAMVVTAGFFATLYYVRFEAVPGATRDTLNNMLGTLGAGWISVMTYYFGSSADSHRKTDIIAGQVEKQ